MGASLADAFFGDFDLKAELAPAIQNYFQEGADFYSSWKPVRDGRPSGPTRRLRSAWDSTPRVERARLKTTATLVPRRDSVRHSMGRCGARSADSGARCRR